MSEASTGVIAPAFTSLSILLQKRQSQTESIIPLEFALLLCCSHRSSLGTSIFHRELYRWRRKTPLAMSCSGQLFALMYWKESFPYLLAMSDKRSSIVALSPFFKTAHCRSRNDFVPRQDVFGEACMENRSSAPRLKNFLRRALDTPQTGVRSLTFGGPRRAARRIIPIALHLRTLGFCYISQ